MPIPPSYNISIVANSSGIIPLMQNVNSQLMSGYFGILVLMAIFLISMISFFVSTTHFGKSLAGSSFITFIMSVFLSTLGILEVQYIGITLVVWTLSIFFLSGKD